MTGQLSPVIVLLGFGSVLGGLLPVLYWQRGRRNLARWFAFGGLAWAISALLSLLIFALFKDTLFTLAHVFLKGPPLNLVLWGFPAIVQAGSFWGTVRTLAVKLQWADLDRDRAMALGLGAGAGSAVLTGLFHVVLSGVVLGSFTRLPEDMRRVTLAVLEDAPGLLVVTLVDKLFAALLQAFVVILALVGVRTRRPRWHVGAVGFMALFTVVASWTADELGVRGGGLAESARMEALIALFALGALTGIRLLLVTFPTPEPVVEPAAEADLRLRGSPRITQRPAGAPPVRPADEGVWPEIRRSQPVPRWPPWPLLPEDEPDDSRAAETASTAAPTDPGVPGVPAAEGGPEPAR